MARLNAEICLKCIIEIKLSPRACNGVLIGKCGFGQEVFNLFNSAAEIVSLHFNRLRLLEEQTEGNPVQKFFEAVAANTDLHLRCGNIRHALDGDDEVFADIADNEGSAVPIRAQFVEFITVHEHLKILGPGIAIVELHNKVIAVTVSDSGLTRMDYIAYAGGQGDMIGLKEPEAEADRVARNVGRCDQMRLVVRLHGIFPVDERNLLAVQPHGEVVFIGDGELQRAIVIITRFNTGDDRRFGVDSFHIAAAAELFVSGGFPYAGMGVVYDLYRSCDTDSAVNNLIDIHILKSLTLRKTVDKMLTVNGDIGKFAAA